MVCDFQPMGERDILCYKMRCRKFFLRIVNLLFCVLFVTPQVCWNYIHSFACFTSQNAGAVFTRATPLCWRPPSLLRPPLLVPEPLQRRVQARTAAERQDLVDKVGSMPFGPIFYSTYSMRSYYFLFVQFY